MLSSLISPDICVAVQLAFHPDVCSESYMARGTCDATCGRCKPCSDAAPSDSLPPVKATPAGDPPPTGAGLPTNATPVGPNPVNATNPGSLAAAPALPPVGPVLQRPAASAPSPAGFYGRTGDGGGLGSGTAAGGAAAPCVADITVCTRAPEPCISCPHKHVAVGSNPAFSSRSCA